MLLLRADINKCHIFFKDKSQKLMATLKTGGGYNLTTDCFDYYYWYTKWRAHALGCFVCH